jgi:serine/threonine protein phosphatase 1
MSRIFAIGDIHGCGLTLEKLLLEELQITAEDEMYFLGDYIDRGPSSKKVIDLILQLQKENYHVHTLRGQSRAAFYRFRKRF